MVSSLKKGKILSLPSRNLMREPWCLVLWNASSHWWESVSGTAPPLTLLLSLTTVFPVIHGAAGDIISGFQTSHSTAISLVFPFAFAVHRVWNPCDHQQPPFSVHYLDPPADMCLLACSFTINAGNCKCSELVCDPFLYKTVNLSWVNKKGWY